MMRQHLPDHQQAHVNVPDNCLCSTHSEDEVLDSIIKRGVLTLYMDDKIFCRLKQDLLKQGN